MSVVARTYSSTERICTRDEYVGVEATVTSFCEWCNAMSENHWSVLCYCGSDGKMTVVVLVDVCSNVRWHTNIIL